MTAVPSSPSLLASLYSLVAGRGRDATGADAIAGVQPRVVVQPQDDEAVGAVLLFARREGLKVAVRGGGTQLRLGAPPGRVDVVLDMAALNHVVEHTPGDLTATFQAGLRLTDAQQALAGAGQWLALDPALPPAATLGGIVATNASGPRRLRYGGVRDQIIGVRVARTDGTLAKGGGKVVKNVAGYDLPKLFTGSLGTLGVIVAVTFRLYPRPASSRTVVLTATDSAPLCALAVRVIGTTLVATAIDVVGPDEQGQSALMVRFETIEAAADDQVHTLIELAGALGTTATILRDGEEAAAWERTAATVLPASSGDAAAGCLVKASLLPGDVAGWLAHLQQTCQQSDIRAQWCAHAGHGLVFAALHGPDAALLAVLPALRDAAIACQGSLVVQDAPPHLAQQMDVWGPVAALDQMRRLKGFFDPDALLNPGRFVGGL